MNHACFVRRCKVLLVLAAAAIVNVGLAGQARLSFEFAEFAELPVTGRPNGENTMGQKARVSYMREEPGGRRFIVSDLNGKIYFLDKQTKAFTEYLDFNGAGTRGGLFSRFTFESGFATGLINVILDPAYPTNGVFYTLHMEDSTVDGSAAPRAGVVPGLQVAGYETSEPLPPSTDFAGRTSREVVLVEWTDSNVRNDSFEGSARELMRVPHPAPYHPMGELSFNPFAREGEPDWRVLYIGIGDASTGETSGDLRGLSQQLDSPFGKVLRIVPDLRSNTSSSRVSPNGRYRIPNDNPFVSVAGARGEVWAYGIRNPHRLTWDIDPSQPGTTRLIAFNIGSTAWETILVVKRGANYGYPVREGIQVRTPQGVDALPADDTLPVLVSSTVSQGTVRPTYAVAQYKTGDAAFGDAIAGGFVYRGTRFPALRGKIVFGDITTGRLWYAEMADIIAADDAIPQTQATIHEIGSPIRRLAEEKFLARGGTGNLPGSGVASGRGRVDLRFAVDDAGEIYVLTKGDGMIRQVTAAR